MSHVCVYCVLSVCTHQASESRGLVTEFEKQLSDKQQDILHLQHLLDCCRGDLESVRGQLSSSEDVSHTVWWLVSCDYGVSVM